MLFRSVKDLQEIADNIKNKLEIIPVKWIDKVLEVALERQPEALPEPTEAELAAAAAAEAKAKAEGKDASTGGVTTH